MSKTLMTRQWGELKIADDQVIQMPDGLLGFEDLHRFAFLDVEEFRPFTWFVSLDDPELSFAVADPQCFHAAPYPISLSEADENMLDLEPGDPIAVFVITAVGAQGQVTGNLKGPIVLNTRNRLAKQIVTYGSSLSIRQPILNHEIVPLQSAVAPKGAGV